MEWFMQNKRFVFLSIVILLISILHISDAFAACETNTEYYPDRTAYPNGMCVGDNICVCSLPAGDEDGTPETGVPESSGGIIAHYEYPYQGSCRTGCFIATVTAIGPADPELIVGDRMTMHPPAECDKTACVELFSQKTGPLQLKNGCWFGMWTRACAPIPSTTGGGETEGGVKQTGKISPASGSKNNGSKSK